LSHLLYRLHLPGVLQLPAVVSVQLLAASLQQPPMHQPSLPHWPFSSQLWRLGHCDRVTPSVHLPLGTSQHAPIGDLQFTLAQVAPLLHMPRQADCCTLSMQVATSLALMQHAPAVRAVASATAAAAHTAASTTVYLSMFQLPLCCSRYSVIHQLRLSVHYIDRALWHAR
jgi:hypothetical protein